MMAQRGSMAIELFNDKNKKYKRMNLNKPEIFYHYYIS